MLSKVACSVDIFRVFVVLNQWATQGAGQSVEENLSSAVRHAGGNYNNCAPTHINIGTIITCLHKDFEKTGLCSHGVNKEVPVSLACRRCRNPKQLSQHTQIMKHKRTKSHRRDFFRTAEPRTSPLRVEPPWATRQGDPIRLCWRHVRGAAGDALVAVPRHSWKHSLWRSILGNCHLLPLQDCHHFFLGGEYLDENAWSWRVWFHM